LVHEFGHYIVAKKTGVKVLELAIGFGPRILGWKSNETQYSLRIIPLGGFCRMLGEDPEERDLPGSFLRKPVLSRAAVLVAGPAMNFVLAILLFFIIFFFFVGVPIYESAEIGGVEPDKPADEAGLEPGDEITAIDGHSVNKFDDIVEHIEDKPGKEIQIAFERNGEEQEVKLVPEEEEYTGRGLVYIAPPREQFVFWDSWQNSFLQIGVFFSILYESFFGDLPADVTGPVGIVVTVSEAAAMGFVNLLELTSIISISLAVVNLLPVPALDGGRLVFVILEGIRGAPIDPEKEGFIHFIGFTFLIMLILFITYQDLFRWDIIQ